MALTSDRTQLREEDSDSHCGLMDIQEKYPFFETISIFANWLPTVHFC